MKFWKIKEEVKEEKKSKKRIKKTYYLEEFDMEYLLKEMKEFYLNDSSHYDIFPNNTQTREYLLGIADTLQDGKRLKDIAYQLHLLDWLGSNIKVREEEIDD